jgi:translation initiation factor 2B subunit (eIF-2B alpha/beta/delta family)/8-oxo-dGTP pyrophosphatase MutT (NUDIX family)
MPTFATRWAACSGSIEDGETPTMAAPRELSEETNWQPTCEKNFEEISSAGLFLDVDYISPRSNQKRIIRVYPFKVDVDPNIELSLKGMEHDKLDWVSIEQLEYLDEQQFTVPSLAKAFHHATVGKYLCHITEEERNWARDKQNGASVMAKQALELIKAQKSAANALLAADRIKLLRPTMVSIVNAMENVRKQLNDEHHQQSVAEIATKVAEEMNDAVEQSIGCTVDYLSKLRKERGKSLKLCTFSRSSTLLSAIKRLLDESSDILQLPILCSESIPGSEGKVMANDLGAAAICVQDERIKELIQRGEGKMDVLLIGADCVLSDGSAVVNKIGTTNLASAAFENDSASRCKVLCCTDKFKVWNDIFPPPVEKDLFEVIPLKYIDKLLIEPTSLY